MAFSGESIDYRPSGVVHAVDAESAQFRPDHAFGYAVCGAPVRVWQDTPFELKAGDVVDRACGAVAGKMPAVASKK
jgi:hypothetical protein